MGRQEYQLDGEAMIAEVRRMSSAMDTMQEDIAQALRALDLGDHARPVSPHEVMRYEVVPAIHRLREQVSQARVTAKKMRDALIAWDGMHGHHKTATDMPFPWED